MSYCPDSEMGAPGISPSSSSSESAYDYMTIRIFPEIDVVGFPGHSFLFRPRVSFEEDLPLDDNEQIDYLSNLTDEEWQGRAHRLAHLAGLKEAWESMDTNNPSRSGWWRGDMETFAQRVYEGRALEWWESWLSQTIERKWDDVPGKPDYALMLPRYESKPYRAKMMKKPTSIRDTTALASWSMEEHPLGRSPTPTPSGRSWKWPLTSKSTVSPTVTVTCTILGVHVAVEIGELRFGPSVQQHHQIPTRTRVGQVEQMISSNLVPSEQLSGQGIGEWWTEELRTRFSQARLQGLLVEHAKVTMAAGSQSAAESERPSQREEGRDTHENNEHGTGSTEDTRLQPCYPLHVLPWARRSTFSPADQYST